MVNLKLAATGTAAAVLLASLTAVATPARATPDGSAAAIPVNVSRTRSLWGLDTSLSSVVSVAEQPYNTTLLGIPLSRSEWQRVTDDDARYARAQRWARGHLRDPAFGGLTQDHATGRITVFVPRGRQSAGLHLTDTAPADLVPWLDTRTASGSLAELTDAYDLLVGLMPRLSAAGPAVSEVTENLIAHRIDIDIAGDPTPEQQQLIPQLPVDVSVNSSVYVGGAYSRNSVQTPIYGGTLLTGGGSCSTNVEGTNTSGVKFLLTAGHCFAENSGSKAIGSASRKIGGVHVNWFHRKQPVSDCDCELIDLPSSSERLVFGTYTGGPTTASQSVFQYSQAGSYALLQSQGSTSICFSGFRSGLKCGITTGPSTPTYDGETVKSIRTNLPLIGGDSGGPVGYGNTCYGPIGGGTFKSGQHSCDAGCTNSFFSVFAGSSYQSATGWTPRTQ